MSNEWDISLGEWRDSNPYGKRIHDNIITYPEWCIYLRKDPRFKCPDHWGEEELSFKSFGLVDCWCWGLGVAVTGSIVPCKVTRGRNAEIGGIGGELKDQPGFLDFFQDVIHFPRGVYPQINDIVLYCEWNTKAQKVNKFPPRARPIRIHSIYVIRQINSYFLRELSHLSCGVESHEIQMDIVNSMIENKFTNLPIMNVDDAWKENEGYWRT